MVQNNDILEGPYLVIGHKEHGKGTFTNQLERVHGLKGQSSSVFSLEHIVYPAIKDRFGYTSPAECYEDRRRDDAMRELWFNLIADFNAKDGTALARALLVDHCVYDGMRNDMELDACRAAGIFKTVFWVGASKRLPLESEKSMKIKFDPSYMIYIDNNKSKQHLNNVIKNLKIKEK